MLSLMLKWMAHEAYHSHPSSAEVKNEWSFHSPNSLHDVYRDNFVRSNQNEENMLENLFLPQKSSVDHFEVVQSNFNSPFLSLPLSIGISFPTVPCLTSSLFHQDYYDQA
jgi:hypothetical protein